MKPVGQVSLDLIYMDEARAMAHTALRSGYDWLEAGTPFF
jgi:3-keto-L-gulonate-6-phosphate decarboxylase